MAPYRNILAIADPEHEGSWGLQRAGQLARSTGATLHLRAFCHHAGITAIHAINAQVSDLARKELVHEQQAWLEREADSLRSSVDKVESSVVWGTPVHERMVSEILAAGPDLVVKDVEHVPTLKRLFFTLLDWHLLRLCPAPLMLVKRSPRSPPRKVVAAIDVSARVPEAEQLNGAVLKAARDLAGLSDASVDVVHVFEGLPPSAAGEVAGLHAVPETVYAEMRDERQQRFEDFANHHAVAREHRHFLEGFPDLVLTGFLDDNKADVLVMGSVNRTGLERFLVGSTAERILGQVDSDVLVLKPHGHAERVRKQLQEDL